MESSKTEGRWRTQPSAEEQAAFAKAGLRGSGATLSESFLLRLCDTSFLSLWSYAGVYRHESGHCKELCDVLVVFGNDIVIFSDKDCAFGEAPLLETAWARWYRRAIEKSVSQLHGAEKYLDDANCKLFLDNACSNPFPIPLPSIADRKITLVAVARGAAGACREYFGSVSGSLLIDSFLLGDEHKTKPFRVGRVTRDRRFVHIVDEVGLEAIFSFLNTAPDLIRYLHDRENLLTKRRVLSAGEEESVAAYFLSSSTPLEGSYEAVLKMPGEYAIHFAEGAWSDWKSEAQNFKKAMDASRLWDSVIAVIAKSLQEGNMALAYPADIVSQERILRYLASETRVSRIYLSIQMQGLHAGTPQDQFAFRLIQHTDETWYVFLCFPRDAEKFPDYQDYRDERRSVLLAYLHVLPLKYPHGKTVIGITFENTTSIGYSVDVVIADVSDFTSEDRESSLELQRKTGFLTNLKMWSLQDEDVASILADDATPFRPRNLKHD